MYSPSKDLTDVLQSFEEFEWGRGSIYIEKDEDWQYPPVIVWRYKIRDTQLENLIVDAVESFSGNIQWAICFRDRENLPGRNWSISPQKYEDFVNDPTFNYGRYIKDEFAKLYPEVGEQANKELPELARHIKNVVQPLLAVT